MTKADWLKLAMPASISLLALAVFTAPLMTNAQIERNGSMYEPIYVRILN
ncbi:hypothetical protein [Synechococcus sp. CC9605]|nr:hypothetical protein [Synechococcus sp. CC9605]